MSVRLGCLDSVILRHISDVRSSGAGYQFRSTSGSVGVALSSSPVCFQPWHVSGKDLPMPGIGPKSATVPIYAAECSPPEIRGALVMQWQM